MFQDDTSSLHVGPHARLSCSIHPLVLFSVIDHFSRRDEDQTRVIGTLLGSDREGVIDVRDCFPVPHREGDQVAVDMEFHRAMYAMKKRTRAGIQIVGWYTTGRNVDQNLVMIHDFFFREMGKAPVLVTVDTDLSVGGRLAVNAYVGVSVTLGKTLGSFFHPVRTDLVSFEAEKNGIAQMIMAADRVDADDAKADAKPQLLLSDSQTVKAAVQKMSQSLAVLRARVDEIVAGTKPPSPELGAKLVDLLHTMPRLSKTQFQSTFDGSVQDLLMVSYLAHLTEAQISLSEKILHLQ